MLPFVNQMKHQTGVYVLDEGEDALIARAWLGLTAEKSIDVQYFIFSFDNVGVIACDYMLRAADKGVKLRILVDDFMLDANEDYILALNEHENIDIHLYNPNINVGKNVAQKLKNVVTDFKGINQRMHNKTFIVDGQAVVTGGRNVADEYFDYDHQYNFRDRDVLLLGKEVEKIQSSFDEFWNHALSVNVSEVVKYTDEAKPAKEVYQMIHDYACDPKNFWPQIERRIENLPQVFQSLMQSDKFQWVEGIQFVSDAPGKNEEKGLGGGGLSTTALIELVKGAEHSLMIQTPYLVVTDLSLKLFKDAVDRGVEIKILTNSLMSTDNLDAFSGYQRNRAKILKTGVRIFEYRPDAAIRKEIMTSQLQKELDYVPIFGFHAKSMIIDDSITVIGTFNLDPRSANLNTECFVSIPSLSISKSVLDIMEEELKEENSWETTLESNPDKLAGRLKRFKTFTRRVVPVSVL